MRVRVVAHETVEYVLVLDVETTGHEDLESALDEAWDHLDTPDLDGAFNGVVSREYVLAEPVEADR